MARNRVFSWPERTCVKHVDCLYTHVHFPAVCRSQYRSLSFLKPQPRSMPIPPYTCIYVFSFVLQRTLARAWFAWLGMPDLRKPQNYVRGFCVVSHGRAWFLENRAWFYVAFAWFSFPICPFLRISSRCSPSSTCSSRGSRTSCTRPWRTRALSASPSRARRCRCTTCRTPSTPCRRRCR